MSLIDERTQLLTRKQGEFTCSFSIYSYNGKSECSGRATEPRIKAPTSEILNSSNKTPPSIRQNDPARSK